MKAWSITEPGGVDKLTQEERPTPLPTNGEVLIKVKAFGINRTEILTRKNKQLEAPYPVLGIEVAGEIIENRSNRTDLEPGTRVAGLVIQGSYQEYAVMPAEFAMILPENLTYEEGAAIPEVFLTAYQTIYWLGDLKKDESILIHAGASGVGTAAIQMAKQLSDAKIFSTSSRKEKLDKMKELGTDFPINYKEEDIAKRVLEETNDEGVDVILDFIGASYYDLNLKSAKIDSRWILIGTLGGSEVEQFNILDIMQKRIHLKGTLLTPRSNAYKGELTKEFAKNVMPYFATGEIQAIIHEVVDFSELPKAHQMMENNVNIGKIIVKISE
ncbi:NAD(P)H-quinone oxidoreductase [Ruoffia sp. FAM 20857]|uniref:NAD(P)H-quinone oxidoreductase n=1 Tax=Ruoffia sp. FAM 20857 TaxID=3259515 RepID=UPI003883AA5B